jgi:hypothetical protein
MEGSVARPLIGQRFRVRAARLAEADRAWGERRLAALFACRLSAEVDAAPWPLRFSAFRVAFARFADGFRPR